MKPTTPHAVQPAAPPAVQPTPKLEHDSTTREEDPTSTVQPGKKTSKELPPAQKESLKQATVEFVKDAVGGIACASLSDADAQGVLFSLDKDLQSFSLTGRGTYLVYEN